MPVREPPSSSSGADFFTLTGTYTGSGDGHFNFNALLAGGTDADHRVILNFPDSGYFQWISNPQSSYMSGDILNQGFMTMTGVDSMIVRCRLRQRLLHDRLQQHR